LIAAFIAMRYESVPPELFTSNRARLAKLLPPNSLVVVNANDIPPTNADGVMHLVPNSDLFYLSGIEQEQTILLLYPDADEEEHREILFVREPTSELELWEGHKWTKEEARAISGIKRIRWLHEFPRIFHRLMCECSHVFLNTNEHKRAVVEVQSREARFVADTIAKYPLHDYQRLAPLLHRLRAVKSEAEMALIRRACKLTGDGFERVLRFTRPGVREAEIEAELAHEFIRQGGRFAYQPIIAAGANACHLHYVSNSHRCSKGQLLLMDVAACYANYNSDMTRTIPVSGKFTPRQKRVYRAVLRILRQCIKNLVPGKKIKDWQKEAEQLTEKELVDLGLITMAQIKRQDPDEPAFKKYFMHGVGHPLGLDVHDVGITTEPLQPGWVMTVEPAIYIREEGFAVRLENDVWVTEQGPLDLMENIPIEPDEIEAHMKARPRVIPSGNGGNGNGAGKHTSRRRTNAVLTSRLLIHKKM
jgi:Xaa-Pro aminopeptidase